MTDYQQIISGLSPEERSALKAFCSEINDRLVLTDYDFISIQDLPPQLLPRPEKAEDFSDSRLSQEHEAFLQRNRFVVFLQANKIIERHDREGGRIKLWINAEGWKGFWTYLQSATTDEQTQTKETKMSGTVTPEEAIYEVKYTHTREIILNGFLLGRPNFDSENHIVFEYVYKHPNRDISLDEIEKNLQGRTLSKTLPKIVENWGFTGRLKKAFFDVSKLKIKFRNPISSKDLRDFDIENLRFPRSSSNKE
jgi:hypothetical protein